MMAYIGRLRERSLWLQNNDNAPASAPEGFMLGEPDLSKEDGVYEFSLASQTRLSLPGLARERIVDMALANGSDWLLFWDADMVYPLDAILRLIRHNKPVVGTLGFTSRAPILPCVYKIREAFDPIQKVPTYDSETVVDYPRNQLFSNDGIGGELAFGAGISLYNMNVFRQIPKPWFNSTGCGEDWFFCVRCQIHNIPRYLDSSINPRHKVHDPQWADEAAYDAAMESDPEIYERVRNREPIW